MYQRNRHWPVWPLLATTVIFAGTMGAHAQTPGAPPGAPPGAGAPGGGPPGGGPGGPGGRGGPPPGPSAPSMAALYIDNGGEDPSKEYVPGQYRDNIKTGAGEITIQSLDLSSGDYTYNGIVVTGGKSIVTINDAKMRLGVTKTAGANDQGGAALSTFSGATVYLNNSDLEVDGAQRYVSINDSKLIVNDSRLTQTGNNQFTTAQTEPRSNPALLIYGTARANMSVGQSQTYYFNSTVTTEGWAALSTDSGSGNLYAYNTTGIAQHGGYGTYADSDWKVWLYGSRLESAENGAIIARSGQITIADGAAAPADVLQYNRGKTTSAGSVVRAGRNAVMIHAPDMGNLGKASAACGTLRVINSTLETTRDLRSARDYAAAYGPAVGAYVNYISGVDVLLKSTSANILFDHDKFITYNGVILETVLNSDANGNYLHNETDGAEVKPIAVTMKNSNVRGDIEHMDYQRIMNLSLDNATLTGAIISGTVQDWNKLWSGFPRKDAHWVVDRQWNIFYGVRLTLGRGSTWVVTAPSLLESLTLQNGTTLKGKVAVNGTAVTPVPGQTYTGKITVGPE